jgi:hypothetical protein
MVVTLDRKDVTKRIVHQLLAQGVSLKVAR